MQPSEDFDFMEHLGQGLLLSAFGSFKEAMKSLVQCQQLAQDECGEYVAKKFLCQTIFHCLQRDYCHCPACTSRGVGDVWDFLVPLFSKFTNEEEAQGWASFFIGAAAFNYQPLKHVIATEWLEKALNSAASHLLKFEASWFLGEIAQDDSRRIHYFTTQCEAARRIGKHDLLVYALYHLGEALLLWNDYDGVLRVSRELTKLAETHNDSFFKGVAEKLCGTIAQVVGQHAKCIDINLRVIEHLKLLPTNIEECWNSYLKRRPDAGLSGRSSPTRVEWTTKCLINAWDQIALSYVTLEQPEAALKAQKEHLKLVAKAFHLWDPRHKELLYLKGVAAAHIGLGKSATITGCNQVGKPAVE